MIKRCYLQIRTHYRVRHKSDNTPFIPRTACWRPARWRPWHPCHAFRTSLPPTTIYCEPGAYDMPFVGWRGVNRRMPHRGVNRLMPHPVCRIFLSSLIGCNTSASSTRSFQLIFSILHHHISKHFKVFSDISEVSRFQHCTKLCSKHNTLLVSPLNLSQICCRKVFMLNATLPS